MGVVELLGLSRWKRDGRGDFSTPFLRTSEEIQMREKLAVGLSVKELYNIMWRGSFPDIALSGDKDRDLFDSSYTQTYLQRDVRDLAQVGG